MAESADHSDVMSTTISKGKSNKAVKAARINEIRSFLREMKSSNGGGASDCVYVCVKEYTTFLTDYARYNGDSVASEWKSPMFRKTGVHRMLLETLRHLLDCGSLVDAGSPDETPIMCAVDAHDKDLVKLLMEYNADPTVIAPNTRMNAVALAVILNDVGVLDLILAPKVRAKINDPCCDRLTPIELAVNKSEAISNLLVQNGADKGLVMQASRAERTLELADPPLVYAVKTNNLFLASILLEHGENVNQGCVSNAPIHYAIGTGSVKMLQLLIQYGVNLDQQNEKGYTPLGLCLQNADRYEIAETLIESGCSWRKLSTMKSYDSQYPPLDIAAFLGFDYHLDVIRLLLDKIEETSENTSTVYICPPMQSYARSVGEEEVQGMIYAEVETGLIEWTDHSFTDLEAHCTKFGALHKAVNGGNLQIAKYLCSRGAYPRASDQLGSLLHEAVMATKFNCEMLLFALQFDLPINGQNNEGNTPLVLAARNRDPGVCRLLLEHGAHMDIPDRRFGETAVSISVYFGFENNAEVLLCHGASPDIPDERDTTALYWAIFNCREKAVQLLLDAGAKLTPSALASFPKNLKLMKNPVMKQLLTHTARNPRSLQHYCRLTIRSCINKTLKGPSILPSVALLPLPHRLKEYVVLRPSAFKVT